MPLFRNLHMWSHRLITKDQAILIIQEHNLVLYTDDPYGDGTTLAQENPELLEAYHALVEWANED